MALNDYDSLFQAAGREWNIDPLVLKAMAAQESGGDPQAVSKAGARGVMQIMPQTGRDLGVTNLHDPAQSIFGGAKYLSQLIDQYKKPALALAAYNAGPQRVDDYVSGKGSLPSETTSYVPAVASHYQRFSQPYVIGDSLAAGVRSAGKYDGSTQTGAAPDAVLRSIQNLPGDSVSGRNIILSSGVSNNPSQADLIAEQIKALKAKGAGNITVLGVGDRSDLRGANDQIAAITQQAGAQFHALDPSALANDRVHLADYKPLASAVTGAPPKAPAPSSSAAVEAPNEDTLSDLEREAIGLPPRAGAKPVFQVEPQSDVEREAIGAPPSSAASAKPGQIDPVTGQPYQFTSNAPDTPLVRSLGKPIASGNEAGPVAQAATSLGSDPEQRRRIMASQLFPNLSPLEAQSRVFYGPDNRLAAVDDKGNPYFVDPEAPSLSLNAPRIGNPLLYAASGAGGALPVLGGIAGGALAGPGSLVVGPAAAAGGAAVGDLARQYIARGIDPSATPRPIDLGQTVREAALSGAGQFGGGVVSNALAPNALRVTPGEVNVMRAQPVMADTRAAYARAGTQGVDLTPGQASGLPSLLQYEDAATTMPQTVDQATAFYRRQGNQLAQAGSNMLDAISPNADKTDAALMFSQGAQDATRAVRQQANAAARPAYKAAEGAGNVMSPDLAQLVDLPVVQSAMDKAGKTYQNLYGTAPPNTPDFALWDLTKRQLDDAYTVAQRAGERTDAMAIDNIRQRFVQNLDNAYPTYAQARATAAPGQRLASQLESSGVGDTASAGVDERARAIVAPVFNQNPRAIAQARDAFTQAGRSDEWNAGVRAYVQDAFDRASQSQQGLNPSMLRRQVWGNVDNRDAIRAALTPQQFDGFDNFMRTVEDVSRTFPVNSLTSTRLNARGSLAAAATDQGNVRAVKTITSAFSPFRLADTFGRVGDAMANRLVQGNMQRIVGRLFSPDGLQYLEAMSAYSPGSQRAMEATGQLVGRALPRLLAAPEANGNNPLAAQPGSLAASAAAP